MAALKYLSREEAETERSEILSRLHSDNRDVLRAEQREGLLREGEEGIVERLFILDYLLDGA